MAADMVSVRFEGKTLACRGDTSIAVALWEQGIRRLSHSPKYGHPRGLTCGRGQCTSCLMRVDGVPNVRTCETPIRDGMVIQRQDTGSPLGPAMLKTLDLGDNFFPVGFYYKWFTRPPFVSRIFLRQIRPLTGVGRVPDKGLAPADLPAGEDLGRWGTIVVGAGPSGLDAINAGEGPVLLLDENGEPGGQRGAALQAVAESKKVDLDRFPSLRDAFHRQEKVLANFRSASQVTFRGRSRVIAGFAPDGLLIREGDKLLTARTDRLVWAAGALDNLGLFPGNDTPGVIGPRALYRLVIRDGLNLAGKHILLVGGGLDFWLCGCLLAARGANLSLVVTKSGGHTEVSAAVDLKWRLVTGLVLASMRNRGDDRIEGTFVPRESTPGPLDSQLRLQGDLAVICRRGKPVYDIPYQLGADLVLQPNLGGYAPRELGRNGHRGRLPDGGELWIQGEAAGRLPAESEPALSEEGEGS